MSLFPMSLVRSSANWSTFPLIALLAIAVPHAHAQVFVVGEKTAEADAVTEFHATHVQIPDQPLDERGRLDLIRNLEAEQGFAHRQLPLGAGLTLIANGNMNPSGEDYKHMLYMRGQSAGPGDRMEISHIDFKADRLVLDFNGGPYAKHRFLSHVSINNMQLAQEGPIATGCRITLIFEGGLPEISAAEVKALLDPLVDFKAKSPAEAFANTLSPKVRDAVYAHEILVGMNQRTVLAALGEPHTKHREQASNPDGSAPGLDAPVYEEWIYGKPPEATQFVRFKNGKVARLEIAALGKPIEIHDKNEVEDAPAPALVARTISNGDNDQPDPEGARAARKAPTLMQPGEKGDGPATTGKVYLPADTPAANVPSAVPPAATTTAPPVANPDAPKLFAGSPAK